MVRAPEQGREGNEVPMGLQFAFEASCCRVVRFPICAGIVPTRLLDGRLTAVTVVCAKSQPMPVHEHSSPAVWKPSASRGGGGTGGRPPVRAKGRPVALRTSPRSSPGPSDPGSGWWR